MTGTPVRVLLARHGETEFNVEGRWQGQQDSPLTERGVAQARELAVALAGEPLVAVYSSDLGRAVDTARVVAEQHGLSVRTDPRLREIDTGEWTNRVGREIRVEQPELMEAWLTRPAGMRLPGGETLAECLARALAFFDDELARYQQGETVLVITHGTIGQCILVAALGQTVDDLWLEQRVDNCQISRLEWTAEAGSRVIELSDVRHLEAVGSLKVWRVADHTPPAEIGK
jgi:probable phosphoglycerate mutase